MEEEKIILTQQEFEYLENNYKCGYISGIPALIGKPIKCGGKFLTK